MKTLSGERLTAMIDNLTCIHETHADEGTGAIATSFAYTWHSGTFEIEQQTVTPPAVPSGQNGSGAGAARKERFDDCDRLAWSMDELGRVSCRQYSKTRLVSSRVYDDIPASGSGTEGSNFEQTTYGYETFGTGKMGRQNRTLAPDGTITRVVLDARGNTLETWIGTNDENASDPYPQGIGPSDNNMVQVAEHVYDVSGNIISTTQCPDAVSGLTTTYEHDWRNRLTGALAPGDVVTHYELDNLGRTIWTKIYASADYTLSAGELRGQTQSLYDARGRVYESRLYEVDPGDGAGRNKGDRRIY